MTSAATTSAEAGDWTRPERPGIRSDGYRRPAPGTKRNNTDLVLEVGDRVSHDKYGLGMVIAADGIGPRATVTIDFGTAGKVRLMLIGGVPMVKL